MSELKDDIEHPKDTPNGAIFWERSTAYNICGDRVRKTVIIITPHGVLEMTPEFAKKVAGEIRWHADDMEAP